MGSTDRASFASPPLVALFAWVLPGAGYLLLGQRGRAFGVGITIIALFLLGLLVGGVRVIEVPGYNIETGQRYMVPLMVQATDRRTGALVMEPGIDPNTHRQMMQWSLASAPLNEIRDKPWSVPQALAGPMAILAGAWSVYAAQVDPATSQQIGALSHSRINEIGSLYLSVAGLLNLMAIIDSAWRASHLSEQQKETA